MTSATDAGEAPAGGRGSGSRLRRILAAILGPAVLVGLLAYLLAAHGGSISHAADRAGAGTLAAVTALSLLTLLARTEAVLICLHAMAVPARRLDLHGANGLTALASTVNHYVAAPVRAALLRRIDPARAPAILQMVMVDAATTLIEGLIVVVLIVVSASTLHVQWWVIALLVVAALAGLGTALALRRRFAHIQTLRGLDVLLHSRGRLLVAALMLVVIAANVARTMLVLHATGLHPTLIQGTATFVAAGVLSTLLLGPSAGTAGAPLIVFGHRSVGAAGAAGLILSATAIIAAGVYAAAALPAYLRASRRGAR